MHAGRGGFIPAEATEAGVQEDWYVNLHDSTDGSWYTDARTQCEDVTAFVLNITEATMPDVTVTFRVDMACPDPSWHLGGVFFTAAQKVLLMK